MLLALVLLTLTCSYVKCEVPLIPNSKEKMLRYNILTDYSGIQVVLCLENKISKQNSQFEKDFFMLDLE